MKRALYLLLIYISVFASCTITSSEKDQKAYIDKAFTVTESFYKSLSKKNYSNIHSLFGTSSKFTKEQVNLMVNQIIGVSEQRFGVIESRRLKSNTNLVTKKSGPVVNCDVIYETVRNNKNYLENFKLSLFENQIKITDYFVTPVENKK
ncbi:hypothetical protein [Pedobacter endophyticus]|uniref:DUF4019 domain-containing protein n=1 Tax=Pedobacter endophyticus TaxID=2789740 RepID=A0A7U3Q5E1_9SPHI|nr:hypothetical protein [Pedobacter endophyticus]QPH38920.1 hypothetical protein IZT61_17915 [Pedobacter endophyticus]